MLRLIGQLSLYGTQSSLDRVMSIATIPGGSIAQVGAARKRADVDSWCYSSPWYRFHLDALDQEVHDFILAHGGLESAINDAEVRLAHALFTLCPVDQTYQDVFACVLSRETLNSICRLGLGLQIAPASVMPEAPFWVGPSA